MDFANLDLRAASERGSWVHLTYRGEPLGEDGKPSRVLIKGMGSKAVSDAMRRVERIQALCADRISRAKDRDADALLLKFQSDLEEAMGALIVAATAEWENIEWEGKPLDLTGENILRICGPGTLFFDQVSKAIAEEHRLFTKADSA